MRHVTFLIICSTICFVTVTCSDHVTLLYEDSDARILDCNNTLDSVFLGSARTVWAFSSDEPEKFHNESVGVCFDDGPASCYRTNRNSHDCNNYIRSCTSLDQGCDSQQCRLYFCGTNAEQPQCFFCTYSSSEQDGPELQCKFSSNVGAETNQTCQSEDSNIAANDVFQKSENENATSFYYKSDDKVFYGVREISITGKSILGSIKVDPSSGVLMHSTIVRTRSDSDNAVNDANFVGIPFLYGDKVYYVYRETAEEFASLSSDQTSRNAVYSRIARVCSNDVGTTIGTTKVWTSFLKQRLICQTLVDDEFSIVYDEIQDFKYDSDSGKIHAIFTNSRNAPAMSALCTFDIEELNTTFNEGSFFGSSGSVADDLWRENTGIPSPRPGLDCNNQNTGDTDFQRDYLLMKPDAMATATAVVSGDRFSALQMNGTEYIIASEAGCIYTYRIDETGYQSKSCPNTLEDTPIRDLSISSDVNTLFVGTPKGVFQVLLGIHTNPTCYRSPSVESITVRPNMYFDLVYQCDNCNVTINDNDDGSPIDNYIWKMEVIGDNSSPIKHIRVLILNETTISFDGCPLDNITISTYKNYTCHELDERDAEWNSTYSVQEELWDECETPYQNGTFALSVLKDVQLCDECTYQDCDECTYQDCDDTNT